MVITLLKNSRYDFQTKVPSVCDSVTFQRANASDTNIPQHVYKTLCSIVSEWEAADGENRLHVSSKVIICGVLGSLT